MLLNIVHFIDGLHNQSPLVHGWWVGATIEAIISSKKSQPPPIPNNFIN